MTSKAVFKKNGRGLWAQCDASQEILAAIKDGKDVVVSVHAPRNPQFLRLYWAVLTDIADSGAWEWDADLLDEWIKRRLGYLRVIEVNGERIVKTKSIAMESMGADKFRKFFDRAMFYVCTEIIGEPEWETFRDAIVNRIEGRYRDPREQEAA